MAMPPPSSFAPLRRSGRTLWLRATKSRSPLYKRRRVSRAGLVAQSHKLGPGGLDRSRGGGGG
jgi:hypothetical protein